MGKYIGYKIGVFFCWCLLLCGCSAARYVGEGEYLLNRVRVQEDSKLLDAKDMKKVVRQRPNTRILGVVRFHLGLYNLSGRNGDKRFNKWLRRIGEEPVVYSPYLTERSVEQLSLYLNNKGYYHARVKDTVHFRKKKAEVVYRVTSGEVTRVRELAFRADSSVAGTPLSTDTPLYRELLEDSVHTLLKRGMPLDMGVLEQERERLTDGLRRQGYYNFSKNLLQYYADTLSPHEPNRADLMLAVANSLPDSNAYKTYLIGNIRVNMDYDPLGGIKGEDSLYIDGKYGGYEVLYRKRMKIRPKVILESIQFGQGELYDVRKVASSYVRLQALNLFKFVNILFRERAGADGQMFLDCDIQLTPMKRQSYNVFLEGTNNSGNIGVGGNFSYNHKNLFHGGENLTMSVWGALKKEKLRENEIFSTTEVGAEVHLVTPQFWLPVLPFSEFRKRFAPRTSISFSYSREHTQFYRRRVASMRFGYLWRQADNRWNYNFDLIDLNYVMMPYVESGFVEGLRNQYVKSAYTDHMILSAGFSAIFADQSINSTASSNYFRGNVETSGNFLWGMSRLFRTRRIETEQESYYHMFGVRYAQFIKADGEYRFNHYINRANRVVYRLFIGCGLPYGNMKALPFEEAYFCGGANDLRAWQSRRVGPGAYQAEDNYPNSVGDFKLEANLEYRFKLFWLLEGALFLDAGNVWNLKGYEERGSTRLSGDIFRQFAVGTGAGLRVNVTFFLLRLDWGFKLHDPAQVRGDRFVLFDKGSGFRKPVWNIAIGYPF